MTKKDMAISIVKDDNTVYREFISQGYSENKAFNKAVNWYVKNCNKDELKDMYNSILI